MSAGRLVVSGIIWRYLQVNTLHTSQLWLFRTRLGTRHKDQNREYSYVAGPAKLLPFHWTACNYSGMMWDRRGLHPEEEVLAATRERGCCRQAKIKVCIIRAGHAWRALCDKYWTSLSLSSYVWNAFMTDKRKRTNFNHLSVHVAGIHCVSTHTVLNKVDVLPFSWRFIFQMGCM